jgi:hypothetical protein
MNVMVFVCPWTSTWHVVAIFCHSATATASGDADVDSELRIDDCRRFCAGGLWHKMSETLARVIEEAITAFKQHSLKENIFS